MPVIIKTSITLRLVFLLLSTDNIAIFFHINNNFFMYDIAHTWETSPTRNKSKKKLFSLVIIAPLIMLECVYTLIFRDQLKTEYQQRINFHRLSNEKKNSRQLFHIAAIAVWEKISEKFLFNEKVSLNVHAQYPRHFPQWINVVGCCIVVMHYHEQKLPFPHRYFLYTHSQLKFILQLL